MTFLLFDELAVTDLYVRLSGETRAIYQQQKRGRTRANAVVPPRYADEIRHIAELIRHNGSTDDSVVELGGARLRLSHQTMSDGEEWACLRVIKSKLPDLDKLGIMPAYVAALRELGHRDGLIMLTGATGMGKTTTAVALLVDYLKRHGGIAVTIEDPSEYMLQAQFGEKGFCFQVDIGDDAEWAEAIKRSLRWAPRYLFVGEIRTPKAAEQVLRAATTGHLVLTTLHAGSPEEALMGLKHLAEQAMGGGAELILAAGLTAVVHQTMMERGPHLRMVATEPNNMGDAVRALVREDKVGMLGTYIDKMSARLSFGSRELATVRD
jgi:twitching motility protein PilT